MTTLTDQQRIDKINELIEKISPLNYDKIFQETNLHFLKEDYFKTYDEQKRQPITETETNLTNINRQLVPLFSELRKLQILYLIQYDGEFSNINGSKYWQTQTEYLYLQTDCNIDTTTESGWNPYLNDPTVRPLLIELQKFLYDHRFSNFKLRHIKKNKKQQSISCI